MFVWRGKVYSDAGYLLCGLEDKKIGYCFAHTERDLYYESLDYLEDMIIEKDLIFWNGKRVVQKNLGLPGKNREENVKIYADQIMAKRFGPEMMWEVIAWKIDDPEMYDKFLEWELYTKVVANKIVDSLEIETTKQK